MYRFQRQGRYHASTHQTLNIIYREHIDVESLSNQHLIDSILRYQTFVKQRPNCFLSFDEIIAELTNVMETNEAIRKQVQQRFTNIFVDEYQDVDNRQEALIRLLSNNGEMAHVCAVGDDDQAIYRFRGATVDNILSFEHRYPNARRITLSSNFRSTHAIVEITNAAVIGRRTGRKLIPGLHRRLPKAMEAKHFNEITGRFEETMAEHGDVWNCTFDSEVAEASFVADRIQEMVGLPWTGGSETRGLSYADIAILCRSLNYTRPIMAELDRRHIPYIIKGAKGLFESAEIKVVHAAFCLLFGCQYVVPAPDRFGAYQFHDEISTRAVIRSNVDSLVSTGKMPYASSTFLGWIATKRVLFQRMMNQAERARYHLSRRLFPQELFYELLEQLGAQNTVQISTMHQAKGLEWPVVFIPTLTNRRFPSQRRNSETPHLLNPDECIGRPRAAQNTPEARERLDEELRLWYVAITRSKKFLFISGLEYPRTKTSEFASNIQHDYVVTDPTIVFARPDRITATVPVDATILPTNFSDLRYYWDCPRDYLLRRLMGFSPGVNESYGYGQQIHNQLALLHDSIGTQEIDDTWMEAQVDEHFNLRYTRGEPLEAMKSAAKRILKNYLHDDPDLPSKVLHAEKPFEFIIGDAMISGTIDLLNKNNPNTADDTHVEIVDFKTGRVGDDIDTQARLDSVQQQLQLYAIATHDALGLEPLKATAHFLYANQAHVKTEILLDLTEVETMKQQITDTVASIKSGIFPIWHISYVRFFSNQVHFL